MRNNASSQSKVNRYGLNRDIPSDVKRKVRHECGFGCVICGASIINYEHIDPEFYEARKHDPGAMCLLCEACHGKVTRGFWSKDKVKAARAAPRCKQQGFSWGEFDFGQTHPAIIVGGMRLGQCEIPVQVGDVPIFSLNSPEEPGAPFRLTASITDSKGTPTLTIIDNEWKVGLENYDAEFVGGRIKISEKKGPASLILCARPPDGIEIEKAHMRYGPYTLIVDSQGLEVVTPQGVMNLKNCGAFGCRVGLQLGGLPAL